MCFRASSWKLSNLNVFIYFYSLTIIFLFGHQKFFSYSEVLCSTLNKYNAKAMRNRTEKWFIGAFRGEKNKQEEEKSEWRKPIFSRTIVENINDDMMKTRRGDENEKKKFEELEHLSHKASLCSSPVLELFSFYIRKWNIFTPRTGWWKYEGVVSIRKWVSRWEIYFGGIFELTVEFSRYSSYIYVNHLPDITLSHVVSMNITI